MAELDVDRQKSDPPSTFPSAMLTALAQLSNRNSIIGTVTDTTRTPINRIRVELQNEVEMMIKYTYTDASGQYSFRNLSTGTFIIKVNSDGTYIGQSARISLVASRSSQFEQQDFSLKSRGKKDNPSSPSNAGSVFAQEVPEGARKHYERAIKQLEQQKQTENGLNSLKEALTIFPTYYLALERLGIESIKREKIEEGYGFLTKAVEINPGGASAWYALGVASYKLKQWNQAADSLRRSLSLAPNSPNAGFSNFYLGLSYVKTGNPTEAEKCLKRAYELGGDTIHADGHMYLAQLYSDAKRYNEAADELELFLKKTPDALDASNIRNIIKGLREKARTHPASI
jgi:tetratricopeptide (TPR) repeat protein